MKIVRFAIGNNVRYGILRGESIQGIVGKPYRSLKPSGHRYQLNEVKLLAPCTPSKIVAVGLNYRAHAKEVGRSLHQDLFIFLKPPTAIIGPEDNINILYHIAEHRVDFEGELAVVIKKRAWQVSEEKALDYVLGYTCFNDVSDRNIQRTDNQLMRAKGFDTFAPMGPCIETELNPGNVVLETYLNEELKQRTNTNDLIYSVPKIISFVSHTMTLLAGDVIATGTPSGVAPMQPSDTVEVKIERIGTLRNYVVKGS